MELSEIGLLLKASGSSSYYVSQQLRNMLGINSEYISDGVLRARFHPSDVMTFDALGGAMINCAVQDEESVKEEPFSAS